MSFFGKKKRPPEVVTIGRFELKQGGVVPPHSHANEQISIVLSGVVLFRVDGRELSTWRAWDSLFIPEILGRSAHVTSADPESGGTVRLTVTPERIERVEPNDAVISFIWPDARVFKSSAANVMAGFCHFIFFFESRSSGDRWASKHPGTFLFSLEDAFALAKRLNGNKFGS